MALMFVHQSHCLYIGFIYLPAVSGLVNKDTRGVRLYTCGEFYTFRPREVARMFVVV